ncbi:hypothetical protein U1Q18_005967, partial [Sarracenia purpurea var. burkii]
EKYRLKKQKKYAPRVLLRRPFTRSICEAYFKKYPTRIGFLRVDALSLLLSMANVSAHSDVLVVDMVGGILTGSVAERLGGTGYVCNTYIGATPYPMDIVRMFNFSNETCKRILRCSFTDLCSYQSETSVQTPQPEDAYSIKTKSNEETSSLHSVSLDETALSSENRMLDFMPEISTCPVTKAVKTPKAGEKASHEPLATCMHNLQLGKMAVGLQISEPWLREYQVLPSRTHPLMQMSAFGGGEAGGGVRQLGLSSGGFSKREKVRGERGDRNCGQNQWPRPGTGGRKRE